MPPQLNVGFARFGMAQEAEEATVRRRSIRMLQQAGHHVPVLLNLHTSG